MATLTAAALTLADWAKRLDPNGQTSDIVELLSQTNEILDDMLFLEGNLPTGHQTTVRTGLPSVTWRLLNQGVTPSKSHTAQITENTASLEAYSEVDAKLAALNGNTAGFRMSEATAFIEAMGQEAASTLFYGNAGLAPEEFTGLAQRYSTLGQNCITGGGAGADNTSVWLVIWGPMAVHGIFPKGSRAGIDHQDKGLTTVQTGTGIATGRMEAFLDHWSMDIGLALRDWRYAVRIPNIDISNLTTESSAANLIKLMIKAIHRIPFLGRGRAVFYMNRTVREMLEIQCINNAAYQLKVDDVEGKPRTSFRGIPIKTCDAIVETETVVA